MNTHIGDHFTWAGGELFSNRFIRLLFVIFCFALLCFAFLLINTNIFFSLRYFCLLNFFAHFVVLLSPNTKKINCYLLLNYVNPIRFDINFLLFYTESMRTATHTVRCQWYIKLNEWNFKNCQSMCPDQ